MTIRTPACSYKYTPCRGKVEWHHPISSHPEVGMFLCEGHHSILQGRCRIYITELCVNIVDLYADLKDLELSIVSAAGFTKNDIDKC